MLTRRWNIFYRSVQLNEQTFMTLTKGFVSPPFSILSANIFGLIENPHFKLPTP